MAIFASYDLAVFVENEVLMLALSRDAIHIDAAVILAVFELKAGEVVNFGHR